MQVGTKVKTNGIGGAVIEGSIVEAVRSGGQFGFNIYTVEVDPSFYSKTYEARITRTEWNVSAI